MHDCGEYVEKYDKKHGYGKGKKRLEELLLYHIVEEVRFRSDLDDGDMLWTLEGSKIEIVVNVRGQIFVEGALIRGTEADQEAKNGVLHGIKNVLDPHH